MMTLCYQMLRQVIITQAIQGTFLQCHKNNLHFTGEEKKMVQSHARRWGSKKGQTFQLWLFFRPTSKAPRARWLVETKVRLAKIATVDTSIPNFLCILVYNRSSSHLFNLFFLDMSHRNVAFNMPLVPFLPCYLSQIPRHSCTYTHLILLENLLQGSSTKDVPGPG